MLWVLFFHSFFLSTSVTDLGGFSFRTIALRRNGPQLDFALALLLALSLSPQHLVSLAPVSKKKSLTLSSISNPLAHLFPN